MSASAPTRGARSTRRGSLESTSITHTSPGKRRTSSRLSMEPSTASGAEDDMEHQHKIIQKLKDQLRNMTEAKEALGDKVIELEEKAQYHEANARLSASMLSSENMDLKEKTRKLGIQLSAVEDERDTLAKEKQQAEMQNAEMEDEATTLSRELSTLWIKFRAMKSTQEDYVKQLFTAQESVVSKEQELAKVIEKESAISVLYEDEKKDWGSEKLQFSEEITSLQEKLGAKSKNGAKQVLDWEQDKNKLRNFHKQEKSLWATEKKGYLDQIASFKVKVTSLSVQRKAAPPEWVLEKHKLMQEITDLKSQIAVRESDQYSNNSRANLRKLEKKYAAVKAKLVEVMEEAKAIQAQNNELRAQLDSKNKKAPVRRRQPKKNTVMDIDSSEEDSGPRKRKQASPSRSPSPPPPPRERSRRTSVKGKKISYRDMDAPSSNSELSSGGSSSDSESDDKDDIEEEDDSQQNGEPATNQTSGGKSEKADGSGRKAKTKKPDADDGEFRPKKKMVRERSPSPPPPTVASLGKKRSNEGESRGFKVVVPASTASATLPLPKTSSLLALESASTSSVASSDANTSTVDSADSASSKPVDKIKKKRKLLSGKGLEELGEMLNNPDAPFSSTPSHQFNGNKSKSSSSTPMSRPPTSAPMARKPNQAKMDALNAIKMQFSIPKPRTLTPGDRED
ncbi:hypothetical protein BGZ74_006195 [Mortierella antarctica]|nr:hypothetical protein BGZ74_006195 [Mortierella antarctica]